jgi:membrane protein YqaA with SNARE-associated domain
MGTDYTPDVESSTQRILVLAGFTFIPMLLTLLVGWVVAGFRKPN